MTLRLRILAELTTRPRATATELGELLTTPSSTVSTQLSNLCQQGEIEVVDAIAGAFGRTKKVYAITAVGREFLANPKKRPRRTEPEKVGLLAETRALYQRSRIEHIERQRRAGIPDALIFGDLIEPFSTAVRG